MSQIRCPICGHKVRVSHHLTTGGRIDCFACRRSWIAFTVSGATVIQKIRYERPHSGTERGDHPVGRGKHPVKITDPVRQLPNVEVAAWS